MPTTKTPHTPEAIIRDYREAVLSFLRRYVGNPAVAEDLLQETWLRMTRGLDGFAGNSSIKTWLFAIASRVAADYLRSPANRAQVVDIQDAWEIEDPQLEIGEKIMAEDMSACVRQVIDSLPDAYRTTLLLHDLQDFSLEQTAEVTGSTPGATKIRLHRARQRLRAALDLQCSFSHSQLGVFQCDRKAPDDQ